MSDNNFVVCTCNHCAGKIEFAAENSNQNTACPHCGMETVLFDNRVKPKVVEPSPEPKKTIIKKAQIIKHKPAGGTESDLETAGTFVVGVSIFVGLISLLSVFFAGATGALNGGAIFFGVAFAVAMMIQGWIASVLMKGFGEIIRLLKKLNELKYAGQITQPEERKTCSNCYSVVGEVKECPRCGATFES